MQVWMAVSGEGEMEEGASVRSAFTDGDDRAVDDWSVLCYCSEQLDRSEYLPSFSPTVWNGFQPFSSQSVWLLGVRASVSQNPISHAHTHTITRTVANILHTWVLIHTNLIRQSAVERPQCTNQVPFKVSVREQNVHLYLCLCVLCVCVCVLTCLCLLLAKDSRKDFSSCMASHTKEPLSPIMHHHNPECISPFKFTVSLCWTQIAAVFPIWRRHTHTEKCSHYTQTALMAIGPTSCWESKVNLPEFHLTALSHKGRREERKDRPRKHGIHKQ